MSFVFVKSTSALENYLTALRQLVFANTVQAFNGQSTCWQWPENQRPWQDWNVPMWPSHTARTNAAGAQCCDNGDVAGIQCEWSPSTLFTTNQHKETPCFPSRSYTHWETLFFRCNWYSTLKLLWKIKTGKIVQMYIMLCDSHWVFLLKRTENCFWNFCQLSLSSSQRQLRQAGLIQTKCLPGKLFHMWE